MNVQHQSINIDINSQIAQSACIIKKSSDSGTRFVDVNLYAGSEPFDVSSCTVTADFVINGYFETENVSCTTENNVCVVPLESTSQSGIMLVELKITDGEEILSTPIAFKVRITSPILNDAKFTDKSVGTIAEIIQEVAAARGEYNSLAEALNAKANKTDVETALAGKADNASVASALTSVNTELANKANKTDVDTALVAKQDVSNIVVNSDSSTYNSKTHYPSMYHIYQNYYNNGDVDDLIENLNAEIDKKQAATYLTDAITSVDDLIALNDTNAVYYGMMSGLSDTFLPSDYTNATYIGFKMWFVQRTKSYYYRIVELYDSTRYYATTVKSTSFSKAPATRIVSNQISSMDDLIALNDTNTVYKGVITPGFAKESFGTVSDVSDSLCVGFRMWFTQSQSSYVVHRFIFLDNGTIWSASTVTSSDFTQITYSRDEVDSLIDMTNTAITQISEGVSTFAVYSDFFNGQVGTSGSINTSVKYRVTSVDIMQFDYDLNVSVDDGFTGYVVEYSDGEYKSIYSLGNAKYNYVIPSGTEFRLHIRRTAEDTTETANIEEFVNSIKFQTKTAVEISKLADEVSIIGETLDETNSALSAEITLNWLQGNVPPSGGGVGTRIIAVMGLMTRSFTISWTDEDRVVKVWGYDSEAYSNRVDEISVNSGDTVNPTEGIYYVIVTRTEDSAVIKPVYGDGIIVTADMYKVDYLDKRVTALENKIGTDAALEDEAIPDYYYEDNYLTDKINEIREACAIVNGVTFAFITDVHFADNQKKSKYLLSKILDETNIPFVIYGGDTISAYGTEEELQEQIAEFNDFKSRIGKYNLFCTRGNHDFYNTTSSSDKTMHSITTAHIYDSLFRDSEHIAKSVSIKNGCYCIDNEPQKTRIVMLNTSDLSSDPDHTGGGVLFRGSTLQWLSDVLTEKKNYKIIIVCHHPVNYENEDIGNDFSGENSDGLFKLIAAFKNKTTFTTTRFNVEVNADFTDTSNELICVVSGHRHKDIDSVQDNVLNIVTTGDAMYSKDGYGRKAGTISEQAFDIYCIDYDRNTIKTVRVGAGESRAFDIKDEYDTDESIVGLEVDYENNTFERLASAANLSSGSDFDKFEMYGGRKRCNVTDDGEIIAYYGDENYTEDGTNGQVMVYQPKFYYKVVPLKLEEQSDGEGYHLRKADYYVCSRQKSGFKLHPAFYDENGNEVDYILMSAYEGCIWDADGGDGTGAYVTDDSQVMTKSADKFSSIAGVKPASGSTQQLTAFNIETMCQNRGDGWHSLNVKATGMEQILMIIELGTMDVQAVVGDGVVSITNDNSYNCSSLTGSTSGFGNETGIAAETINEINGTETSYTGDKKVAVSYRGVENFWGNIWKFIHGINVYGDGTQNGGIPYICTDFNFAENKNSENYESVGFTLANSRGYISAMGYGNENYDWLFMVSEASGNSSAPVGDYSYGNPNLNGYKIARLGGYWSSDINAGAFYWYLNNSTTTHNNSSGSRLIYVPTKII